MNIDPTEDARRAQQAELNERAAVRERLEQLYPQVWDTTQLGQDFEVLGFLAPIVAVREKATGKKGSLYFQHSPRYYFDFQYD